MAIFFMKKKDEIRKTIDLYELDMRGHAGELECVTWNLELVSSDKDNNYFNEEILLSAV